LCAATVDTASTACHQREVCCTEPYDHSYEHTTDSQSTQTAAGAATSSMTDATAGAGCAYTNATVVSGDGSTISSITSDSKTADTAGITEDICGSRCGVTATKQKKKQPDVLGKTPLSHQQFKRVVSYSAH
jgi:hypothetical protein